MEAVQVQIVDNPEDAPNYARDTCDIRGLTLTKLLIVKNGTKAGRPTVDLQLVDAEGNEFVALTTVRILATVHEVMQQLGDDL